MKEKNPSFDLMYRSRFADIRLSNLISGIIHGYFWGHAVMLKCRKLRLLQHIFVKSSCAHLCFDGNIFVLSFLHDFKQI